MLTYTSIPANLSILSNPRSPGIITTGIEYPEDDIASTSSPGLWPILLAAKKRYEISSFSIIVFFTTSNLVPCLTSILHSTEENDLILF